MQSRLAKTIYLLTGVFMAGAAVAAVVSLLFAPKTGRQTRKQLINALKRIAFWQNKRIRLISGRDLRDVKSRRAPMSWFERLIA